MNYLEIARSVRAQAGIAGEGPSNISTTTGIMGDVLRWTREAYNEIQTEFENWNFLFKNYSLTVPEAFREVTMPQEGVRVIAKETFIIQEVNGTKTRIRYVPYSVWKLDDKLALEAIETKLPTHVTILPNKNLLFNTAAPENLSILFDGYREPHVMVNSTDLPIFDVQYHTLIQLKALTKYGTYYNAQEVYKASDIAYKTLLSKMKYSELPRENLVTPPFVAFA